MKHSCDNSQDQGTVINKWESFVKLAIEAPGSRLEGRAFKELLSLERIKGVCRFRQYFPFSVLLAFMLW